MAEPGQDSATEVVDDTRDAEDPDQLDQREDVEQATAAGALDEDGARGGDFDESAGSTAPQHTGDARVDEALARLAGLDELPLAAQVTVFDDVHRLLQDALTASDDVPAPGAPAQ